MSTSPQTTAGVQMVAPSEELLSASSRWKYLLDVRTEGERLGDLGHIPTSHHCNSPDVLGAPEPAKVLPQSPDSDTPILVICRSGMRAGAVAQRLVDSGFKDVGNLKGGMMEWNRLSLPKVEITAKHTEKIMNLTSNDVRDMILACFEDATRKLNPNDPTGVTAKDSVRLAFESEAGTWENPPKEKFPLVIRALGEMAKESGHPGDAIAQHSAEFSSLVATWLGKQ